MSTEDLGPELPKSHLALPALLGKGQRVAIGPLYQGVRITLLVPPDSLCSCLRGEPVGGCLSVCLPDAAFLPVCESVLPSPSVLA